jgi:hypothetical protein
MKKGLVVLAVLAGLLSVVVSASLAAPVQERACGKVALHFKGALESSLTTSGAVAATGRFTATGAIIDKGAFTDYWTQKNSTLAVRRVMVGKKGTITFVILFHPAARRTWTIVSGTKTYKGLHGKGTEGGGVTDFSTLDVTLRGTVCRERG